MADDIVKQALRASIAEEFGPGDPVNALLISKAVGQLSEDAKLIIADQKEEATRWDKQQGDFARRKIAVTDERYKSAVAAHRSTVEFQQSMLDTLTRAAKRLK